MDRPLSELKSQEESEKFDFKRFEKLSDSKEFAKHLVGFANRHGGEIALGLDDSGEIQGKEIDYDEVMQTITNLAYSRCSPQVRFDDEYLRTPEGDILILKIRPRDEIPHAVVERKEGQVVNRDYWIRTKNSTRRVSDIELNRLFSTSLDPDFAREFQVWTMLSVEEHQPPRVNLPDSIDNYRALLSRADIGDDIQDSQTISSIAQELFPFSLLRDLNRLHFSTWDTKVKNSAVPFQRTSLISHNMPKMVGSNNLDQNRDSPSSEISEDEIHFVGFGDTLLSEHVKPFELIEDIRFHTLPDTEFFIEYSIDESDDDEARRFPHYEVTIQRNGEFEITIANNGGSFGRGFPTEHPIMDVAIDNKFRQFDLAEIQKQWEYSDIRHTFNAEFGFPDDRSADIQLNERYAERLWHVIEEQYSVEKFLESLPNTELYKANHKLDMIIDGLFQQ